MKLTATKQNDVTVITLDGELDADAVGQFNSALAQARQEQARDFIIDLREVSTVDSAGLEAFTALQRQCEEELGMLQFCGARPALQKILEMTRLSQQLTVYPTLEDALASFAPA